MIYDSTRYFIYDFATGQYHETEKPPQTLISGHVLTKIGEPSLVTVKELGLVLALEAAATYERGRCCKDICVMCRNGRVVTRVTRDGASYWCHDLDTCFAASIRERACTQTKPKESE